MEEKSKRIAQNTLLLYFRMLVTMGVGLFTSRVILNTLGVSDFGIYNVVGGFVGMFSMISGSLSSAIGRFITFELGKGNTEKLKIIFSTSVNIQIIFITIGILVAEVFGVWFLNTKMVIPTERLYAANWVFQFSIICLAIDMLSIPYNACIIAHEKMSAFAYISIYEVITKLLIAWLIVISPIDKLIFYSLLMCLVSLSIRMIYGYYCNKNFTECKYQFTLNKLLLKEMFSFAGWNFIGQSSAILREQGGNLIINLFCGPTVNAARGIASQVNSAVSRFYSNFMMAVGPQITKSYAAKDYEYMTKLAHQSARLSFFLLFFLSLPIIVNIHYILYIWLHIVPEHTSNFVILVMIFTMCESLSNPLITIMLATGRIRNYQIVVGGLQMLNLPTSYILLKLGCVPETVLIVAIFLSLTCLMARLIMLKRMINFSPSTYCIKVLLPVLKVSIFASIIPMFVSQKLDENFQTFLLNCIVTCICSTTTIYFWGCNINERKILKSKIQVLIQKLHK